MRHVFKCAQDNVFYSGGEQSSFDIDLCSRVVERVLCFFNSLEKQNPLKSGIDFKLQRARGGCLGAKGR